jgi:hypothetical protein
MAISNNGDTWFTYPYAPFLSWALDNSVGTRTVYARWKDTAGNWSWKPGDAGSPASDIIFLDNAAPVTTADPIGGTKTGVVTATLTCNDGRVAAARSTILLITVRRALVGLFTGTTHCSSNGNEPTYLKFFRSMPRQPGDAEDRDLSFVAGYTALTLDLASPTLPERAFDALGKLTRYLNSESVPNNGMDF